jgi:inositol 1,4,5-triphosphate receptor type 1/inositol 1,4,5-triphosphate receptor type 3
MKIARAMIEFRIISDINEVSSLVSNLFNLLDGRSDVKHQKPIPDKERYCADEENSVVAAIKLEIIEICNLFIDISQNRKISFFVNDFKQRADTTESFHWKGNKEIDDGKLLYFLFNYQVNRKPCTILDKEKVKSNLLDILQDLTKYENPKLSKLSLNLIFRIYYQKEELSRYLSRIEMLVSRTMMRSYNDLSINISELRRLIIGGATFQMQGAAAEKVKLLIEEICKETQNAGSRAQRILRNLKAHEIALQILKINFFDESVRDLLWRWSIRLLIDFVKHNPENQKILWSKLDIFFPKLKFPETTILLVEIVQNNRNICLTIEEKLIRNYIDTLAEQKVLEPRFLYFLRAIVMPEGKPLKKNQFFVVNNMLQRGRDVIVLFTGKAGIKERNKRIQRNEHITEPQGILNYHIELLYLFCDCAEGKYNFTNRIPAY